MKSPLLLFIGLSAASHAVFLGWYGSASHQPTRGQQIQISLLSGDQRASASKASDAVNALGSRSRNTTRENDAGNRITSGKDSGSGLKQHSAESSTASINQRAVIPESGELISREINRVLAASFVYPPLALRQGHQGRVLVTVSIQPDGSISDARLARSSGYRTLDLAAVDSVLGIGQVPQLRRWLQGRSISINVPVNYQLIGA